MSVKKLLFAVSLSIVLSSLVSAQTPTPAPGEQGASGRGPAESAKPEPAALADESTRPEVTAEEKEAFHAITSSFTLRGKGKTEEARKKAVEVLRLLANTGSYRGFYMRGLAQQELGNDDSALADFGKSIQLNPRWWISYYSRGKAYAARRDHDRAIADFDKLIQLDPQKKDGYYLRANAYFHKRDHDRAIADLDRVIKVKPQNADPYVYRGDSYSSKGDYGRAVADYSEAIRLEPASAPAYQNRAKAYEKLGEGAKAQADRGKAAELGKLGKQP